MIGLLSLFAEVTNLFGPLWVADGISNLNFRGICVINDALVWVVGENGKVYKRTGGVHSHQWVSKAPPGAANYHFNDVCFVNPLQGWIVGEKRSDPDKYKGVIFYTPDSGHTWIDQTGNVSPPLSLPTPFLKVKMVQVGAQYHGYITCGNGTILATINGGQDWVRRPTPWDNPAKPGDSISVWYNGLWVDPANPQNLWVSGDAFGLICKSNDGGQTWTSYQPSVFNQSYAFPETTGIPYGTKLAVFDVDFANPNVGYIALSYGKIGKTTNGGATWTVHQYEPQPTWFYDVAKGRGDTCFAVGNFGVVHRFTNTTDEQEHFNSRWSSYYYTDPLTDFFCVDASSGDYAYAAGKGTGSVRQRYLPASGEVHTTCVWVDNRYDVHIWVENVYENNDSVWGFNEWGNDYILRLQFGSWTTEPESGRHFYLDPLTSPRLNYYFDIYVQTNNSNIYPFQQIAVVKIPKGSLDSLDTTWVNKPPVPNILVDDRPNDQGNAIRIMLQSSDTPNVSLRIGRSTSPNGPFCYLSFLSTPYNQYVYDTTAQTGMTYYYKVISFYPGSSLACSDISFSVEASDDIGPDPVDSLVGVYLADDSLIKITWKPPNPQNNPDIAGYWVCPEFPDGMRYRLAHSSPVTRTVYYWPVSPPLPESAGIAVAAMDYSGHISNWVLKYVPLRPSVAITNNPSATGLNNSPKLVYDAVRGLLHTVYSSDNSVIYKNSHNGGVSWYNETNLGAGFYPALTKDNTNELHCAWVNLSPPPIPPDPTQPKTFYLPWEQYTWELKYCWTENGKWQTEDTKIIDAFAKVIPTPVSMHFSAPCITTTEDSVHILMEKTAYILGPGPAGWHWVWNLCYYSFPKGHPELLNLSVIDSAYEYIFPPREIPEELVKISDPSAVADKYNNLHIAYTIFSQIRYQNKNVNNWSGPQTISGLGTYDQPSIGINGDEITVVWAGNPLLAPGTQILCRRKFVTNGQWGNIERLDKGDKLSIFPICLNNQVLWTEQIDSTNYEIYYSRLSGYTWTEPENLSKTSARSIFCQAAFSREPRRSTLYYLFTDGNAEPYYLFSGKKEFITEEIPVYAVNLGGETPSASTIERDGFIVYGDESYKTVDYDSTQLVYSLSGFEPSARYEIAWDWYHESNEAWKQRLRIDNIFNEHKWVPSGELVSIRKPIPQAVLQDGIMEITDEITSNNGLAVLSGFAIYDVSETGGGPQGEEAGRIMLDALRLLSIYPNPAKGLLRIRFNSPDERTVKIKLYDVCGRLVHKENITKTVIGMNEVSIKQSLSSGVYFVQVESGDFKEVKKAVMVR